MVGYQPDGKRKMKSFYGRTQKEVKEKAAKYLEDLRAAPEISKEMAFTDWADIWYESMKGQVAEQTYESYQYTLNILKTIQSLTGHADVDMTEHYLHVQKEVKENAAKKLDSLFKKGKPTLHIA